MKRSMSKHETRTWSRSTCFTWCTKDKSRGFFRVLSGLREDRVSSLVKYLNRIYIMLLKTSGFLTPLYHQCKFCEIKEHASKNHCWTRQIYHSSTWVHDFVRLPWQIRWAKSKWRVSKTRSILISNGWSCWPKFTSVNFVPPSLS